MDYGLFVKPIRRKRESPLQVQQTQSAFHPHATCLSSAAREAPCTASLRSLFVSALPLGDFRSCYWLASAPALRALRLARLANLVLG